MDLQPEMRDMLMRNGLQAHVALDDAGYRLIVQGHDSPLLVYPITERQMLALTDWGTNTANKKAYNVLTSIVGKDFYMPKNFVHARNANGRVAMGLQPHSHTTVGIAGMDEVLGHIEVLAHDARQHVVGLLVGSVRSPVRECQHLTFGDRIDQQGRVMSLHDQPIPCIVKCNMGLKPVAHQHIAHFGLQVHLPGIGIRSYRHSLIVFVMRLRFPLLPPTVRP